MSISDNVIGQKENRSSTRGQNLEQVPRTKARVAMTLLRREKASSALGSQTLYPDIPVRPKGNVRNELIESKATHTRIPSI